MMKIDIVSARPDRAGKYRVHFSDGSSMGLYRQTVEDYGLYAGKELTEEEMSALRRDAGKMSAKMRAVRIVAASNVSVGDLEHRLISKGENPADEIVARCISKGYGLARAKQALHEKRIPKDLWQEVLEDYPEQTESIMEFLRNRLGERWDQRDLRKATDALLRRGHSYQQIRKALAMLGEDSFFQEED